MSKYTPYKDVAKLALSSMSVLNGEWQLAIQGLPTIDIVRCRECKYGLKTNFIRDPHLLCKRWSDIDNARTVKPDDFCSHGVKKGADNE